MDKDQTEKVKVRGCVIGSTEQEEGYNKVTEKIHEVRTKGQRGYIRLEIEATEVPYMVRTTV